MDTVQECTITAMPGTPANNVNVDNVASAAAGPNSGTAGRPSAREIEGGSALAHPFITPYKSHLPSHLFQGSAAKYSGASTPGAASSYGVESPLLSGDEESLDDGDESLGIRARREDSLGGLSFAYSSENSSPSTGRERSVEDSSPASGKREETPFPKDDSESIEESENAGLVHKSDEAIGAAPVSTSRAVKQLSKYEEIARPPPLKLVELNHARLDSIDEVSEESTNLKVATAASDVSSTGSGGAFWLERASSSPAAAASSRSPSARNDNIRFASPRQTAIQSTLSPLAAKFTSTAALPPSRDSSGASPSKKSYRRTPFPSPTTNAPDTPGSGYDGSSLLSYYMQTSPTRAIGRAASDSTADEADEADLASHTASESCTTSGVFDSPSPVLSRALSGERAHRSFPETRTTMMSTPKISKPDVFANKSDPLPERPPRSPSDAASTRSRYPEERFPPGTSSAKADEGLGRIASPPLRFPQGVQHGEKFDFTISSTDSDQEDDASPSPAAAERSFSFSELDIHNTSVESLLAREKIRDILWHSRETYRADEEDILPPDSASLGPVSPSFGQFPEHALAPWHHLRDGTASPSSVVTERPLSRYDETASPQRVQTPFRLSDAPKTAKTEHAHFRMRKIPSLVGPNALPYARCPSGIDSYAYDAEDPSPHEPIKDVGPVRYHGGFKFSITPKAAALVAARSSKSSSPLPSPTTQQSQDAFGRIKAVNRHTSPMPESDVMAQNRAQERSMQESHLKAYGEKYARRPESVSIGSVDEERYARVSAGTAARHALPSEAIANMVATSIGSDIDTLNPGHVVGAAPALGQSVTQDWMFDPAKQGWVRRDKALPIKQPPPALTASAEGSTAAPRYTEETSQQVQAHDTAFKHAKTPSIAIIDATPPRGLRQYTQTLSAYSPQQQFSSSAQPPAALLPFLQSAQAHVSPDESVPSQATHERVRAWAYGSQMAVVTGVDASASRQSQNQLTLHTRRVLEMLRCSMDQTASAASAAALPAASTMAYTPSMSHTPGVPPTPPSMPPMRLAAASPAATESALASMVETNAKLRLLLFQAEQTYLRQIEQLAGQSVRGQPSPESQTTVYNHRPVDTAMTKDVKSEEPRQPDGDKPGIYHHPHSEARRHSSSQTNVTPAFGVIGSKLDRRLDDQTIGAALSDEEAFLQSVRIGYPSGIVTAASASPRDISPDRGIRGVEEDPAIVRTGKRLPLPTVQPASVIQPARLPPSPEPKLTTNPTKDGVTAQWTDPRRHSLPPRPAGQAVPRNILGAVWSDPKDALSKKNTGGKRDSPTAGDSGKPAARGHVRQDSIGHERRRRQRSNAPSPEERTRTVAAKPSSQVLTPAAGTSVPAGPVRAPRSGVLGPVSANIGRKEPTDRKKAQSTKVDSKGKIAPSVIHAPLQGSAQPPAGSKDSIGDATTRASARLAKGMIKDGDIRWHEFVNAMGGVPTAVQAGSTAGSYK